MGYFTLVYESTIDCDLWNFIFPREFHVRINNTATIHFSVFSPKWALEVLDAIFELKSVVTVSVISIILKETR